jgi:Flp pilus assembly protein protease CpaA
MLNAILGVSLLLLFIASVQDIRKREVADYVSYSLIAISLILRLIWYVMERDISIIIYTLPSFAGLFGFSYLMYRLGQWGGGDVKLIAGISIVLSDFSQIFNFFVNFTVIGVLYGVIYNLAIGFRRWDKIRDKIKPLWTVVAVTCFILAAVLFLVLPRETALLSAFVVLLVGSAKYIEVIDKYAFVQDVPVSKLVEGDWIVEEVGGVKRRGIGLTKEDIEKLKKKGIKKIKVKEGIPFIPVFFIAMLANIFVGNLFIPFLGISDLF